MLISFDWHLYYFLISVNFIFRRQFKTTFTYQKLEITIFQNDTTDESIK